jgi:hypothetical protein
MEADMRGRLKTCLVLSLAAHLAVLGWAASAHRPPVPAGPSPEQADAVTVDLHACPPHPVASKGYSPVTQPTGMEEEAEPANTARMQDRQESRSVAEASPFWKPGDARPHDYAGRILGGEEFARMARIREMTAKATLYFRSAPKEFEGVLRSAMPPGGLREDGTATVSIAILPDGAPGRIDVRSDSPALKSALEAVPWGNAPLPARYRLPCSRVKVTVSVAGERLRVGVEIS